MGDAPDVGGSGYQYSSSNGNDLWGDLTEVPVPAYGTPSKGNYAVNAQHTVGELLSSVAWETPYACSPGHGKTNTVPEDGLWSNDGDDSEAVSPSDYRLGVT
jgi:hypothetical protein